MIAATNIVSERLDVVRQLCQKHYVARLELFGSAANGQFDELHSDLDFLIEFEALPPSARAEAYFGILADLQDLFRRDIDLVEAAAVKNPYFARAVNANRQVLYGA